MGDRPSFLEVDAWIVDGDPRADALAGDPEWARHLADVRRDVDVPPWVVALERPRRGRRAGGVALALALAAAALGIALVRAPDVRTKGGAAEVVVHVEERGGTVVWDGSPLNAGDAVRLELVGFASPYYAVIHLAPGGPELLAAGPTPGDGILPGAWALDPAPGRDALVVVGLGAPVTDADRALADGVERVVLSLR